MKHKSLNAQVLIIAPPEHGKTTHQRYIAKKLIREHDAWLFAHDLSGDWAREWKLPVYETTAAWLADFEARPMRVTRMAAFTCEASELLALVVKLGKRFNDATTTRFAMVLAIDEASEMDESGSTHQGKNDKRASAKRRHYGIAILINMQTVTMLVKGFATTATDVFVFATANEDDIRLLEKRYSMPKGSLARLATLPPFKYIRIRPGRGIVGEAV